MMQKKNSYDFYLILGTAFVLFVISLICVYGMFYFKFSQVNAMPIAVKMAYMNEMNRVMSPFLICLILLLGICVPKRLLPTAWLNRFALALLGVVVIVTLMFGVKMALKVNLCVALVLQLLVFCLAVGGDKRLRFEKKGYWVRVGSSAMHLGIILFVLDLFFYQYQDLHLLIFWLTTIFTVIGMTGCFYAESLTRLSDKITFK